MTSWSLVGDGASRAVVGTSCAADEQHLPPGKASSKSADNCCHRGEDVVMSRQTMSFALPESMREYIDTRVASGSYGNTGEYIRDLVRRDQEEQAKAPAPSDRRGPVLRTGTASNQGR